MSRVPSFEPTTDCGSRVAPLCAEESEGEKQLDVQEKIYGLSLFWKEVSYNFANFDQVPHLDWDKVYREYISEVLNTSSTYEYYRVLQRLCALLEDGHTNVYMPESLRDRNTGFPPLGLEEVQRRAIVSNVEKSIAEKIPIGSEILEVDGSPVPEYLKTNVFPYVSSSTEHVLWDLSIRGSAYYGFGLLAGPPGSMALLTIEVPTGAVRNVSVERNKSSRDVDWLIPAADKEESFNLRWLGNDIAFVALNGFGDEKVVEAFEAALPELLAAKGVVLDIRNNGGGSTGIATAIAEHLTAETLVGAAWRTPKHVAAYKAWGRFSEEYEAYYRGTAWHDGGHEKLIPRPGRKILVPIVLLIGRHTASAAEDLLIYLDPLEHITYVGEPTCGSTGQPLLIDLPGGGRARICTKRDTYPDGRDFVGCGIEPDVLVRPTVQDVRTRRDVVLEKGIEILKEKIALSED
jgi:carboxyl-terminal processing protease